MQEDRSDSLTDDNLVHENNYQSELLDEDEIMNYLESNIKVAEEQEETQSKDLSDLEGQVFEAIKLYRQIKNLEIDLGEYKENFRRAANGQKLEVLVKKSGKLTVSKPIPLSEKTVITVDEKKLESIPELKNKLISSGILKEEKKSVGGSAAAVKFTLY